MIAAFKTEIADKIKKRVEQKETELEEKVENTRQLYAGAYEMDQQLVGLATATDERACGLC
jgi:hypothetical protein